MTIRKSVMLTEALRACSVKNGEGEATTIGALVEGTPALLLFVRHFGCIGCSENIGRVAPRFDELHELGVRILIIGCGQPLFIRGFMERHNLLFSPAETYSDDSLASHKAAGLMYTLWGGLGPRGLVEMARAFVNGHTSAGTQGDIKQQAGAIFVDAEGIVQLYHQSQSLGDHVNGQRILDAALASWLAANPEME